jgi:hypothetical protein
LFSAVWLAYFFTILFAEKSTIANLFIKNNYRKKLKRGSIKSKFKL